MKSDKPITHSFFIAGSNFTGILDENNEVVWDSGRPGARDGYVLSNGNVLICKHIHPCFCCGNCYIFTSDSDPLFD